MASARVVGVAKSLDARVKAIIQAVPYEDFVGTWTRSQLGHIPRVEAS